ncbi:hypothetical protein ASC61_14775 [Aeromicrobium sp. Root344]|uniref:hypothetical protein n=1 Tax=Aeromicrobium sp. Root344 TaxID=1736521 RepID=UPI0007020274|nr:hypothetical protein [Aeromicrobium sp. Root344]KQV76162.1 hypothetical protein ASC61_14775 [Aeromicrobium sp. Root344]
MRELVIGAVTVACLAACTSGSNEPAKSKPTKDVVRTIDPSKATTMKLGEDLKIVAQLPSTFEKQDTYFRGFTADGKVLGSVSLPEKPKNDGMVGGELTTQAYPVLYDVATKKFTVLDHRKRRRNTAVWSIVSSGDFVVWLESPETTASSSAVAIYSYDRRSKKVAELFSTDPPDSIMNGGDDLAVWDGTAYFSRFACCRKRDRGNAAVYSVPIDGSAPATVLVKGGKWVDLAGGSLTYEMRDKQFSRDLETGETKPVPVSPRAKDPGFCGAELTASFETLCLGRPSMVEGETLVDDAALTITETAGRTTVLQPFPVEADSDSAPRHVVPIGPWVGVTMTDAGGADRLFLVDLESKAVKAFPSNSAFAAVNDDNTQALLRIERSGQKTWPQLIVQIPPVS